MSDGTLLATGFAALLAVGGAFAGGRGSAARARPQVDEHMVTELELYIDNTYGLYNQLQSIRANLVNKIASGKYDHSKAPKLWMFLVDEAARRYNKEFGSGSTLQGIDKPTREATAKSLADGFLTEASEYADMLHKKHQKNPEARARLMFDAPHLRRR